MVEGRQLAHSLVSLKGTHLRIIYVMLNDLNFWDLVSSKTKDMVSKEQSAHFYRWLKKEADKLNVVEDTELQLSLLLELGKMLKLPMRLLDDPYKIIKQCDEIVEAVFQQMKKQYKGLEETFEQFPEGNKTEFLVHWEMAELYSHVNAQLKAEEQRTAAVGVQDILAFIEELPLYKQEQIKQQIHLGEWTTEELGTILAENTLSVFMAITEKTGFQFYKYLLERLVAKQPASVIDSKEIAYFSWVTNPDLLLSLIFKSGGLLYRYQNLLFNKGLLPMILFETTLPYLADNVQEENNNDLSVITYCWNKRLSNYKNMLRSVNEMVQKQNDWKKGLAILKEELKEEEIVFQQLKTYHTQLNEKLTQLLKKDPARPYFGDLSVKNNRLQENLRKVESKLMNQEKAKRGIVRSVSAFIKSSYYQTEKGQIEKKIDKVFDDMTMLVLDKYRDYEPQLIQDIHDSNEQLTEGASHVQEIKRKIEKFTEKLADVKQQEKQLRGKIAEAEKQTYGLSQLYRSEMEKETNKYVNHL